jgi:hypothetical protein
LSWFVRTYQDDDRHELLDLLSGSFAGWKGLKGEQLLEWYENNPLGHLICVAECKKKIVGCYVLTLRRIKIGNEIKQSSLAGDLVVHADFRRQGMFLAMGKFITTEAMKEGIEICLGFPNRFAHQGHLKYGWFDVAEIPMFQTYVNFKGFMMYRGTLPKLHSFYRALHRKKRIDNTIKIKQISSFNSEIDRLWTSIAKYYDILGVRDMKYLNWRFNKPNSKYQVLTVQENGEIMGYAVLLVKRTRARYVGRRRIGYIVDLFVSPKPSIIHSLVSHSVKFLKEQKVDVILCALLAKKLFYQVLLENGFFPSRKIPFIGRINKQETDIVGAARTRMRNCENWYATLGDSDL